MRNRALPVLVCVSLLSACQVERRGAASQDTQPDEQPRVVEATPDAAASVRPENGRSVEEHLRDASIAAQIKLAFADDSRLRSLELEPEIRNGVVHLSGQAPSAEHYRLAAEVARGVRGVRGVENGIEAPGVTAEQTAEAAGVTATDSAGPTEAGSNARTDTPEATDRGAAAAQSSAPEDAVRYHVVASGESLWEIARANGTTIDALRRANNLQGDRLRPGQRLRLP